MVMSIDDNRLRKNVSRTLALSFFQVFLVIMPVAVPFFQSRGLTMAEVFTLQAWFAMVVLIMEVPSGYVADVLGRKRTLVLGALFLGVGHSLLPFVYGFLPLALWETCLGISISLISGADLALLYDTEQAIEADETKRQRVVSRLFTMHTTSEAVAAVAASLFLLISLDAAVYAQSVIGWLPFFIALSLVEPPGERLDRNDHWGNLTAIAAHLLGNGAVLRLTFVALSVWGLTTFYAVWLLQKLWLDQGIELAHFGYLWAVLMLVSAVSGRFAERVEARLGTTLFLTFTSLLPVAGYLGLALLGTLGGLLAALTFFVARGFGIVVMRQAFNRRLPGRFRATANSLVSFGFRGAFVVTGPIVGWWLEIWGMSTTLYLLAGASAVIFAVLVVPLIAAARSERLSGVLVPG
jgi:hypothetical protein